MNGQLRFAYSFTRGLQETFWSERRFEYEDSIAACGFRLQEFAGRLGANLFVRGPEENNLFADGRVRCEKGIECEQRLDDALLHVEDAGAENFSAGGAEGHCVERAGTVDGVVMAQDKKLAGRFC